MSGADVGQVEPLVVAPRWGLHAARLLAVLAGVATMAALRGGDLDLEDDVVASVVLILCFWVFAIGLGSLARNLHAGYALRLDAAGVHIPGLETVPWSAVRDAGLRTYESHGRSSCQFVIDVAPGWSGAAPRHYERYLFGPVAGLFGKRDTVAVPVQPLAIAPDDLLARAHAFLASGVVRAAIRADVESSPRERALSGRRLP